MGLVHVNMAAVRALADDPDVRDACRDLAEEIAENVRAQRIDVGDEVRDGVGTVIQLPVEVQDGQDVRVVLAHPAGIAVQAKHGALTKAASAAGVRVQG